MKKTVYVIFTDSSIDRWPVSDLTRGFSHCYAYEQQLLGGFDCFIRIENLLNIIETQIFFGSKKDLLMQFPTLTVVEIKLEVNPNKRIFDFFPINCVSLIKKQLGLNKPFVITPKQLFNHLIRIGGKEL